MRLVQLPSHREKPLLPELSHGTSSSQHFARTLRQRGAQPEQTLAASVPYVVKAGDTLSGIAATFKTRTGATESLPALVVRLASINHLDDPDILAAGQRLTLPPALTMHEQPVKTPPAPHKIGASVRTYGQAIVATARRLQVDPALGLAVARAESGLSAATDREVVLNPRAVSPDGKSVGLFQLTAETGKAQLKQMALRQAYNPLNPYQNMHLGVGYLKELSTAFSTETTLHQDLRTTPGADPQEVRHLAVAAYNAGMGRVARAQAQVRADGGNPARYQDVAPYLSATTQQYVKRVERFAAAM